MIWSGLGKCSLTAAIPVLSVMDVQACPLPTAVLTNQTGYDSYYCTDFTDKIDHYTERMAKTWSYPGMRSVPDNLGSAESGRKNPEFL